MNNMLDLHYCKESGSVFVWDADDWMTLRTKYRIVGELIGSLSSHPRNEGFQGLPMMLMNEEAHLLVQKQYCRLVQTKNFCDEPDEAEQKEQEKIENRIFTEQVECMKRKREEQISCRIDIIISGKKKKMASKGRCLEFDRDEILKEELQKITPLTDANSLVQIPTKHHRPTDVKEVSLENLKIADDLELAKLKLAVYKDLWEKSYYITSGSKFGGDYLVYQGDPVKFHAMYIVKCLKSIQREIKPSNLVAFGRLGVSVNKLTVYAYFNQENNVAYQTLRWFEAMPE